MALHILGTHRMEALHFINPLLQISDSSPSLINFAREGQSGWRLFGKLSLAITRM